MYQIKSDWSEIERELKRLKRIPNGTAKQKLDRVLEFGLNETQKFVHIDTGSLIVSGDTQSTMMLGIYSGTISYGGESMGLNNPVDYAIYELDRGGSHDFMASTFELHPLWVQAIRGILTK